MANTLRFKRGLASGLPTGVAGEPLFTTDTFDLYIGTGAANQRFQKYIASGTTLQYLRGDGSLATFPTNIITGTGVAGQVAYWSGASTITGENGFTWDNTNKRLQFGTGATRGYITYDGSDNTIFNIDVDSGRSFRVGSSVRNIQVSAASNIFRSPLNIFQAANGAELARINSAGNFLLGSTTDNGLRFQVTGDGYFSGDTITNGSYRVSTTDYASSLTQSKIEIGSSALNAIDRIFDFGDGTRGWTMLGQQNGGGTTRLYLATRSLNALTNTVVFDLNAPLTGGSILQIPITGVSFAPTSGSSAFNSIIMNPTINQTGGANGVTRGMLIQPTLTAAADWRSIEWTNNTGWGLYGLGTAANYLAGNTGIRNTTPSRGLEVGSDGTNWISGTFVGSGGTEKVVIGNLSALATIGAHNAALSGWTNLQVSGAQLIFSISGSERMRLDASGNLGLGVTPSAWSVLRGLQVGLTASVSGYAVITEGAFFSSNSFYDGGAFKYQVTGFATTYLQISGTHRWSTAASGTAGTNITSTESMRLHATGNLVIGGTVSTDTTEKLQVNGTMRVTSDISLISGGNAVFNLNALSTSTAALIFQRSGTEAGRISFANSNNMIFSSGGASERMRLDASGNLGLGVAPSAWGTTNSVRALQLTSGSIWNFATTGLYIGQNNFFDGTNRVYVNTNLATEYAQITGSHIWYNAPSGTAGTAVTFTERMRLDASGRLLLGSGSVTSELLQVNGTMKVTGASTLFTTTISSTTNVEWTNSLVVSGGANGDNSGTRAFFRPSGTFGAAIYGGRWSSTDRGARLVGISSGGVENSFIHLNGESSIITLGTATSVRATLDASGNLGLGTASPTSKLDVIQSGGTAGISVSGGTNPQMRATDGTITAKVQAITGVAAYIGTESNHQLRLITNNSPRLTIDTTGAATFTSSIAAAGNLLLGSSASTIGAMNLILTGTTPVASRLTFGTDGTGYSFAIGKNQGGTVTDLVTILDSGAANFSSSIQAATAIAIGTTPDTNKPFKILKNINATVGINFENTSTSSLAFSAIQMGTDVTGGTKFTNLVYASSGVVANGVYNPDGTSLVNNGGGGLNFLGTPTRFYTGGANGVLRLLFDNEGTTQFTATTPTTNVVDGYRQYSADVVAGNAAPHFRTENGGIIKLYQETTGVGNAIFSQGGGTSVLDDSTFDGYTLRQIVKALRNQGILA